MTDTVHVPERRLLPMTAAAAIVAGIVVVVAVMPAEYGLDPTGVGAATGLDRLYAPPAPEEVAIGLGTLAAPAASSGTGTAFRTDTVTIEVGGMDRNWGQIEYKLSMLAGDDLTYTWQASAPLYSEFHGHTLAEDGAPMQVYTYATTTTDAVAGRMIAPVDGIHGWFFRNDTFDPVEVTFTFEGFYEAGPGLMEVERE